MSQTVVLRIDRAIDIAAPPERVWRALTDAAELAAWFQVTIEGALAPGGDVWMTSVHPGHVGQRFKVSVIEMTPPSRVVWKWHAEPQTTVTFTLTRTATGTRLAVEETGFDAVALERRAKVYGDNSQGWSEVLVWLQRHVETA